MSIACPSSATTAEHEDAIAIFHTPFRDADRLATKLYDSNVGESVVYFVGHLAVARDLENPPFGSDKASLAASLADTALRFHKEGWIELTQRRVSDGCYLYVARRRKATRH